MNEAAAESIQAFLRDRRDDQVDLLRQIVRVPSDNPPGDLAALGERVAELMTGLGFQVERHPVPADLCQANGMISATNVIVRRRFGDGPTVALNAHGDVVPPGDGWRHDPYGAEIDDGWLYGRGAAVSKSDFATYAYALLALEAAGTPLAGTVELHFTYDEEVGGGIGPGWLLETGVTKPDLVVCAGFSYGVVTALSGCLHLEVEVRGRSAHAAEPDDGADAIEAMTAVLSALYEHRSGYADVTCEIDGIEGPTLVVGLVDGGINTNVVGDRAVLRLDRRMIPAEDPDGVEETLRDVIQGAVADRAGITVDVRRILMAAPLVALDGVERLTGPLMRHASRVFGTDVRCHGMPLFTDARLYASRGIPTVLYGAGPRTLAEANGHRAEERVKLDDLHSAMEVVALALRDILAPG